MAKILRGVNKRTETDLKKILSDNWQKVVKNGKNTEGVTVNHFDMYHDKKNKKSSLYDDEKKIKK